MSRAPSIAWLAAALAISGCQKPAQPVAPSIPSGIGALEPAAPEGNLSPAPSPAVPAPAAPPPTEGTMPTPLTSVSPPMDLFEYVDASRDARSGVWTMRGGTLISPATPAAAIQINYQPPPAYRWTVVAQRTSGSESLNLGFVIEQRPAMCALEGWGQKLSGLSLLDGQTGDNNATTVRQPVFVEGQPN